jgi:GT2 family glycosyltransferase
MPTYDKVFAEVVANMSDVMNNSRYKIEILIKTSSLISCARNDHARQFQGDWLLFWDSDIVVPQKHIKAINRLIDHNRDIVGGLYVKKSNPSIAIDQGLGAIKVPAPTLGKWVDGKFEVPLEFTPDSLFEVDSIGMGFTLIKREVIERVSAMGGKPFDHILDDNGVQLGEDVSFCLKAKKAGFNVYCDTGLELVHLGVYGYSIRDFYPFQKDLIEARKHMEKKIEVVSK